jgi:hypothetical protein
LDNESIILDDVVSHTADELILSLERSRCSFPRRTTRWQSNFNQTLAQAFGAVDFPFSVAVLNS